MVPGTAVAWQRHFRSRQKRTKATIVTLHDLHEDSHLKVLRILESNPDINQRELAEAVGVSLGKLNFSPPSIVAFELGLPLP